MPKVKADDPKVEQMHDKVNEHVKSMLEHNEEAILAKINESPSNEAVLIIKMKLDLGGKTFIGNATLEVVPVIQKLRDKRQMQAEDPEQGQLDFQQVGGDGPTEQPNGEPAAEAPKKRGRQAKTKDE